MCCPKPARGVVICGDLEKNVFSAKKNLFFVEKNPIFSRK
jgi:hypothetical protein